MGPNIDAGPTSSSNGSPGPPNQNPENPTSPITSPSDTGPTHSQPSQPSPSSSSSAASEQPPPPVENTHQMTTRAKNNITKPKTKFSLNNITQKPYIPTTVNQALRDPRWRNTMGDEFNAQVRNHTFDLVPPHPHQHVIDTKWIFTLKYLPTGVLDRYKARFVARGFT